MLTVFLLLANSIKLDYIPQTHQPAIPSASLPFCYSQSLSSLISLSATDSYLNKISIFSLKSLTWHHYTISSPLYPPITKSCSLGLYKSLLYIIGGLTPTGPSSSVWVLDLEAFSVINKQWEKKNTIGDFPQLYAAGYTEDNLENPQFLYIFGGFTGENINENFFR